MTSIAFRVVESTVLQNIKKTLIFIQLRLKVLTMLYILMKFSNYDWPKGRIIITSYEDPMSTQVQI